MRWGKREKAHRPEPGVGPLIELAAGSQGNVAAGFPVVGIGASAGGLAAFEAFFSGMPRDTDTGMSFVLVQHLAPDHKSILCDLVRRYTRMEVFEVEDGMRVRPDCAYIIPPNRDMAFVGGTLKLVERAAAHGLRLPIDYFFRSLAADQHERAICIVLSGTGSDGTLGLRSVKGEGGMAMAQAPETTDYGGMPASAIGTGLVDYVLPPAEMAAQIIGYVAHAFGKAPRPGFTTRAEDLVKKICILLLAHSGHDFSRYKQNTVTRRVERRMAVHQIDRLDAYLRYLQQSQPEVEALYRDLLIGVTSFFRDPAAFDTLERKIIPRLFAGKTPDASIRVWVPGCSTGEEAYSIAILLKEHMETLKAGFKSQVFATDIDSRAIEQARRGVYASAAADVSPGRLARFFVREPDGSGYRVAKDIRDLLVFSEQDLIRDPPLSRVDLLSCRNLLIYMGGELQRKVIPLFHYALNPGGFLFLGTSETVGNLANLFVTVDRQSKSYQRREDDRAAIRPIKSRFHPLVTERGTARQGQTREDREVPLRELTERALLQQHGSVAVLVDGRGDIFYLHGRTGRYLEPAPGEVGINILKMAREGLRHQLIGALHQAVKRREAVCQKGLRVKTNGDFSTVDLTVRPVAVGPEAATESTMFLVILEEAPAAGRDEPPRVPAVEGGEDGAGGAADPDPHVAALRRELRAKEEYLRATNEELETTNEELKSSNDEMQSVNEELQSTNEELETSKEELQSVNEELATVNVELQEKVADLSRANNDMNNLLAITGIGTIFVDHHLNVQRFTPPVTQVINLIPSDIGRSVGHIVSNLVGYDRLVEDVRTVLDTLVPREVEVMTRTGAWYSLRIRPYRTVENVIEGAVITFFEISEMRRMREAHREGEALRRLAVVARDAHDAITVQDWEGRILAWNPGAERLYGWSESEALAKSIRELIPEGLREETIERMRQLGRAEVLEPYRTQRISKAGRILEVCLTATALVNSAGEAYAIATTEREIGAARAETEGPGNRGARQ
jgi:two-component system, chemotaxis family, CheB/CheR fusion protein